MCLLKIILILCALACPSFGKKFDTGKSKSLVLTRFFDSSKNNDSQQAEVFDEVRRSLKTSAKLSLKEVDCAENTMKECEFLTQNHSTLYFLFDDHAALVDVYYEPQEFEYIRRYCLTRLGVKLSRSLPLPAAVPGIGMTARRLDTFTFDEAVSAKNLSFVIFYASWCPHCQKYKDTWNSLDDHFKDDPEFGIFRVDCMKSQENFLCMRNKVFGFPTVVLLKNGVWWKEYESSRKTDKILDFLMSHRTDEGAAEWEKREEEREARKRAEKDAQKA